jgi:DNA-binding NarL/FixJ family response regulator
MSAIRVVLADDHTLFRAGIRSLLGELEGIEVIGEAGDGHAALQLIEAERPDVALLDIGMAGLNGLEVAAHLVATGAPVRVIILSMHANEEYVLQALRAGAAGYILKDADTVELGLALKAAVRGETYLSPAVSRQVVASYVQRTGAGDVQRTGASDDALARLSERQRETLRLIAQGRSTQEIAAQLQISAKTVEKHRAQLMERLGIHDVAGLVRFAIRARLIDPDS